MTWQDIEAEVLEQFAEYHPGVEHCERVNELPLIWSPREVRKRDIVDRFIDARTDAERDVIRQEMLTMPRIIYSDPVRKLRVLTPAQRAARRMRLTARRRAAGIKARNFRSLAYGRYPCGKIRKPGEKPRARCPADHVRYASGGCRTCDRARKARAAK